MDFSERSESTKLHIAKSAKKRYADAYLVARATVGFGSGIKTVGIILGLLILAISVFVGAGSNQHDQGLFLIVAFVGGLFGIFAGTMIFLIGILVSAQGQTLKASLDCAVHTSPFLGDDDKSSVMSL